LESVPEGPKLAFRVFSSLGSLSLERNLGRLAHVVEVVKVEGVECPCGFSSAAGLSLADRFSLVDMFSFAGVPSFVGKFASAPDPCQRRRNVVSASRRSSSYFFPPFFCRGGMTAVCSAWLFVLCLDKDTPCPVNSEARSGFRQDNWKALNGISYD
jgi:hypothetical protein